MNKDKKKKMIADLFEIIKAEEISNEEFFEIWAELKKEHGKNSKISSFEWVFDKQMKKWKEKNIPEVYIKKAKRMKKDVFLRALSLEIDIHNLIFVPIIENVDEVLFLKNDKKVENKNVYFLFDINISNKKRLNFDHSALTENEKSCLILLDIFLKKEFSATAKIFV